MVLTLVLLPAIAGMARKATSASRHGPRPRDHHWQSGGLYRHYDAGRPPAGAVDHVAQPPPARELFTLSVLALGIAFGAVELFDVSFALGAFFAGMVLNESELSHRAAHDTCCARLRGAVLRLRRHAI